MAKTNSYGDIITSGGPWPPCPTPILMPMLQSCNKLIMVTLLLHIIISNIEYALYNLRTTYA